MKTIKDVFYMSVQRIRRYTAMMLTIVLTVTNCQISTFAANSEISYSEYLDGWYVQAAWSILSNDYEWNAEYDESRQPKIVVTYRTKNAEKNYPAGSLSFTIPGIGGVNRYSLKKSESAADKSDSEWNCTWNQNTDTYTFTNKFEVTQGQSVSGGFELLWSLDARGCENGFTRTESPTFTVQDAGSITMEPLSFSFTSVRDRYRISLKRSTLSGEQYEYADKKYTWYKFSTRFDMDYLARGLYKSDYFMSVELPDGVSDEDVVAKYNGKSLQLERNEDGNLGFYLFKEKIGDVRDSNTTHYEYVYLGFVQDTLNGNKVVVRGHMDRLYNDEENWVHTAGENECVDVEDSFTIAGYGFDHHGYIYDHDKYNTQYENLRHIDDHSEPSDYSDRMLATGLFNGKVVAFTLYGLAQRDYSMAASLVAEDEIAVASLEDEIAVASVEDELAVATPTNISKKLAKSKLGLRARANNDVSENPADDWDDINWKANGLADNETELIGITYGELHPSDIPVATPSEISIDSDETVLPDMDLINDNKADSVNLLSAVSGLLKKAESIVTIQAHAAEPNNVATPTNAISLSDNNGIMSADLSGETSGKTTKPGGNTSDASQIGEKQEYSLVMGDDKLAVVLNSGAIRALEDDEYDIAYVTVPGTNKAYDYEVFGADAQDTHFDRFVLLGTGNTKRTSTVTLPEGVKNVFIRVNGIIGTYSYYAKVGVRFHLDWDSEREKDISEQVNRDGKVVNFSYLRALYVDNDGYEVNDCAVSDDPNYKGGYGKELAERDSDVYKEYLMRDYSNVWLRNPITELTAHAYISSVSGSGKEGFTVHLSGNGTIKSDNGGSLETFSLYQEVPAGMTVDLDSYVSVTGKGTKLDGISTSDFQDHVTLSERDNNGHHFVVADFDFSDDPLDAAQGISVSLDFQATLSYADYLAYGNAYRTNVYLMLHDGGLDQISGTAIQSDEYDIDENGNITDLMAYASAQKIILDAATEWREFVSKYIKSAYSNGFTTDTVTRLYSNSDTDDMKSKSDYQYRLDFGLGSSNAKNIIFFDRIEQGATLAVTGDSGDTEKRVNSAWQGSLVSVDTTQAEKLGFIPTVYYSQNASQEFNLAASGWSTEKPSDMSKVKSIAVSLDTSKMKDSVMKTKQMTYIILNMRAPSDKNLIDKKAVNQYEVQYDAYGLTNKFEQTYVLPSSETYIKLLDNVGKIILQKVDVDNLLRTDNDGIKHYASLTGAKIQVYDSNGKALFEDGGKEVSALGRIVINNVRQGNYTWEETEAPKGYQKLNGKHAFTIDGVAETINIENHRILGSVTLTKQDGDDDSYGPLAGAEFELFKADGTQIFTDTYYKYVTDESGNSSGTNSIFVTGNNGTLTVSDLPWGDYYFKETKAPTGYVLRSNKIFFNVGKDLYDKNTDTIHVNVETTNSEGYASIELKKTDSTDGRPIKDAVFSLYKVGTTSAIKKRLETNAMGEIYVENLKFGEYYFKEVRNAGGYLLPDEKSRETEHVILNSSTVGNTFKISMTNDRMNGSVVLTKSDDVDQLVGGATYTLYHKGADDTDYSVYGTYTTIADKTSNQYGEIHVDNLPWGEYYFIEAKAPKGYELSDAKTKFTINQKTVQDTIYVDTVDNRATGTIKLTKVDKDNKTKVLAGAVYELYKSDGTKCIAGTDYKVSGNGTAIETGTDGTITVTNLKQGAYYLKEIVAPTSYSLSNEFIRFSITKGNVDIVQELTAEDELGKAVLKINKKINEVYKPFGNPTFIFKVTRNDGKSYEKSITLNDEITEGSVTLAVEQGYTYTISEVHTSRYKLKEIAGVKNVVVAGNVATADLGTNDNAEVTFENEIAQYEKFSHDIGATNIVKKVAQLTGLSVEYTGVNPITKELPGYDAEEAVYTIPKSDLIVTAYSDDGTSRVLSDSEYTLDPGTADGSSNSYTGTVSYTEGDITRKTTFSLDIALPAKYDVKYAVSVYGIMQDFLEDDSVAGLTFGPATGASYIDTYVSHVPTGTTDKGNAHRCIHGDNWTTIIQWSKTDPHVYEQCMGDENTPSCTKAVELKFSDKIKQSSYRMAGDGVGGIANSLKSDYQRYDYKYEQLWKDATIRNTLNGTVTEDMEEDSKILNEKEALISAFPSVLQSAIAAKVVKTDTVYNDLSGNNVTTYDKLWLFSGKELFPESSELATDDEYAVRPNEGGLYQRQVKRRIVLGDHCSAPEMRAAYEYGYFGTWHLRSLYVSSEAHSTLSGENARMSSGSSQAMLSPGFCLPGPESTTTIEYTFVFRNNTDITAIRRTTEAPTDAIRSLTSFRTIFTKDSDCPCYLWILDDVLYYYTEASKIYLGGVQDSYTFSNLSKLVDISGLRYFDTSKRKYFSGMFQNCKALTDVSPIANWDTSNVEYMNYVFSGCDALTDASCLSNWDTSQVKEFTYTFWKSGITSTKGVDSWDISNAETMRYMFSSCAALKDASSLVNWGAQLPQGVQVYGMFQYSGLESIGFLKTWKVGNTKYYDQMIADCSSLKNFEGLENWDPGEMSFAYFFQRTGLEDISAAKDWNTSKVTNMCSMFGGCSNLEDATAISSWNIDSCTDFHSMFNSTKVPQTNKYPTWNGTWDEYGGFTPAW